MTRDDRPTTRTTSPDRSVPRSSGRAARPASPTRSSSRLAGSAGHRPRSVAGGHAVVRRGAAGRARRACGVASTARSPAPRRRRHPRRLPDQADGDREGVGIQVGVDDPQRRPASCRAVAFGGRRNRLEEAAKRREAEVAAQQFDDGGHRQPRRRRPALARRRVAARRPAPRAQADARVDRAPGDARPPRTVYVRPPIETWIGSWRAQGFRGITFKGANSRYRPGETADDWASTGRDDARVAERDGTVGPMPETALTPAIRDQIARLGNADIMVGIPSFKNAATIGYVVRAAQAGLVQYFPDLRPVVVNSDAGSPDGTGRVVVETEPPDYIEQILLVRPNHKLERVSLTYPEIDGVGGKGAALRTIFEIAAALEVQALVVVDSDLRSIVPEWIELLAGPDPQGRLRLRRAAVRPLQVRRHDHQHGHLPADAGALRPPHPPADRRRLRGQRRPRPPLPDARRLDRRHQQVRHRHLDDDLGAGRRVRGLPDAARGEDPRPQGPGRRPRADVPPGRRHDPAAGRPHADHWLPIRGSHDVPAYGFERIIDPPPLEVNTLRLLSEFHAGSLTLGETWGSMLAGRALETVMELAAEAGRLGDAARARLGIGGDVASTTATTLEMAEAVSAFHFPDDIWARVVYDLVLTARNPSHPLESLVAALVPIYFGRVGSFVIENRQRHDRPGRGAGRAPGPRVRAAQAVSRRALERRRERSMSRALAAPGADPHPGRQPGHGRGADPARRRDARSARRRAVGAGHRRGARGDAAVGGRDPRAARPAAAPEGARLRARRDHDPPDRAHRPPCRRGHHRGVGRAGGRPHHLRLGRQGAAGNDGRNGGPTVFSPTIDEVVRESPCDIAVVKQRGVTRHQARPRPGPRRPPRRAGHPLRRCDRHATTARRSSSSTSSRRASRWPSGPRRNGRWPTFIKQHLKGKGEAVLREAPNVRNAILREAEKADLVVMGASAVPGGDGSDSYLFGALPEAIAARAKPIGRGGQDPRGDRRRDVRARWRPRPSRSSRPTGRPRRPAPSRPASNAGSASRTSTTPSSATCAGSSSSRRSRASRSRSSCRRSTRRRRSARSCARRSARWSGGSRCSTRSSSSTPRRRTGRARSPRPRVRGSSSTRTCWPATARSAARARRSGSRCSRRPATSSCGPTRTSVTGTTGWSTGRSARCSTSRGCSTSRATTSARSSRRASSRRAAAGASPSSSRGR